MVLAISLMNLAAPETARAQVLYGSLTGNVTEWAGAAVAGAKVEALDALNHPNFANPDGDISNAATFGFVTWTVGTGERDFRFAARLSF